MSQMNLQTVDLQQVEFELRRIYFTARREGVTHEQMGEVTGLPASTFSMWLNGYRPLVKIRQLEVLIKNIPNVEALTLQ